MKAYWLSIYPHWKLLLARPIIYLRSVGTFVNLPYLEVLDKVNLAAFVALSLNYS
jgi:hypothetical protein